MLLGRMYAWVAQALKEEHRFLFAFLLIVKLET